MPREELQRRLKILYDLRDDIKKKSKAISLFASKLSPYAKKTFFNRVRCVAEMIQSYELQLKLLDGDSCDG